MILSIHQPSYFPWLGLLDKIAKSEVYVVMDAVQLSDSGFQHRNLFMMNNGETKFLTIPIPKKEYKKMRILDLPISDSAWSQKHMDFLKNNYRKHPHFKEVMPRLEAYYQSDFDKLVDAIVASMRLSFEWFGIDTKVVLQSSLSYDETQKKGDLVFSIIEALGADCYLSGTGAQAYLDEGRFGKGVELKYNHFIHPRYEQLNAREFTPGLSCLDLVFNLGVEGARRCFLEMSR